MDPSALFCLSYDSLKQHAPIIPPLDNDWYVHGRQDNLTPDFNFESTETTPPPVYINPERYGILQTVKDTFNVEGFVEARDATNPYEQIGKSIFINRAAIQLANIDSVHNISGTVFTFTDKTSDQPLTFCDIASGPGGFTQYLQYRYPNAIGYGITLRDTTLDWSTKFLDMNRFTAYYGPDNTGDLYVNWEHFINYVITQQPGGVDLIMGDGGFEVEGRQQEFLSSRLYLTQALVGITCTKINGTFVLKLFDSVTTISAHILYVLAQCFERILIFKPISSRPANSENYLICFGRKPEIKLYYQLLAQAANVYQSNIYLSSLFSEQMSDEFIYWLQSANSQSLERQLLAAQNILLYLGGQNLEIPEYNVQKFLTIWNLPDTPQNPRSSLIKVF